MKSVRGKIYMRSREKQRDGFWSKHRNRVRKKKEIHEEEKRHKD